MVQLVSGATGNVIFETFGEHWDLQYGRSIGAAGDYNGDGVPDYVVQLCGSSQGIGYRPHFLIHSGLDGAQLHRIDVPDICEYAGEFWEWIEDIDGDGFGDLLTTCYEEDSSSGVDRAVYVLSGVGNAVLRRHTYVQVGERFGTQLYAGVDVDFDGLDDYMVGAERADSFTGAERAGRLTVFSGATGDVIQVVDGVDGFANLGEYGKVVGDINGDGVDDVALRAKSYVGEDHHVVLTLSLGPLTPGRYCTSTANSETFGALMTHSGRALISENDFALRVVDGASHQLGVFFCANGVGQVPFGDGYLCVSGATTRLGPPVQLDELGAGNLPIDLQSNALDLTGDALGIGSTRYFQFWYRDPGFVGGFNLSDGLSVIFY